MFQKMILNHILKDLYPKKEKIIENFSIWIKWAVGEIPKKKLQK